MIAGIVGFRPKRAAEVCPNAETPGYDSRSLLLSAARSVKDRLMDQRPEAPGDEPDANALKTPGLV